MLLHRCAAVLPVWHMHPTLCHVRDAALGPSPALSMRPTRQLEVSRHRGDETVTTAAAFWYSSWPLPRENKAWYTTIISIPPRPSTQENKANAGTRRQTCKQAPLWKAVSRFSLPPSAATYSIPCHLQRPTPRIKTVRSIQSTTACRTWQGFLEDEARSSERVALQVGPERWKAPLDPARLFSG